MICADSKYGTNEHVSEVDKASQTERANLRLPSRRRAGQGWAGSLGLVDGLSHIGWTTVSPYCTAQRTISYILYHS